MNLAILVTIAYGILAIAGGAIGYAKAQSKVSLVSGGISGLLLIFSAILQIQEVGWGLTLAIATTVLLVVVFAVRLAKTRKFMPAGLMVLLGLSVLAVTVPQLSELRTASFL